MNDSKLISFENKLSRDWSRRKKELIAHSQLLALTTDEYHVKVLTRAGAVMLYAHWEGFIKHAFKNLLHLFKNIPCAQIPPNILAVYLTGFATAQQFTKFKPEFNMQIIEFLNAPTSIAKIDIAKTFHFEANVDYNMLKTIILVCNDDNPFKLKEKLINEMVGTRHAIAHGEQRPIEKQEIEYKTRETILILEQVKEIMLNAAKSFLVDLPDEVDLVDLIDEEGTT